MAEEHIKTQVLAGAPAAYGGFWIRFLAYLVDALILFIAFMVIGAAAALAGEIATLVASLLVFVGPFLYFAAMQSSARQASYGKALVGLKVAGNDGSRISFLRSLGRELAKLISAFPLMIGFLLAGFTRRKQALHDMVASTVVVRDSPGHVVAALALMLVGFVAPFVAVVFLGAGILMAFMGGMMGGMLGEMAMEGAKPPAAQVAKPRPRQPAPPPQAKGPTPPQAKGPTPAPQAKAPPAPPAKPAAPVALSPEEEKLFGGGVAGMDGPSMTRVGPALLELSSFFANGPNVWIKVHLPPALGMGIGRTRATVVVKSVADPGGGERYDAKSNFEQPFFHAFDLTETKSGVHRLQGIRSVRLLKGTTEAQVHKAQGVLTLALPQDIQTATFRAADAGKSRKLAGMSVTATKVGGSDATVELEGPAESLVDVRGYDAKGPVQRERASTSSSGGKVQRTQKFRAPIERIEVLVAPRFLKRDYPFTLVRGERPAPLPAEMLAAAPAKPAAPPKPAAPAVAVAKVRQQPPAPPVAKAPPSPPAVKAPPPPPPPVAKAPAPPPPVAKVASAPVPLPAPGPKYADLMTAVMYRDPAGIQELLAFGKWPDKPDSRGMTPLAVAVMLGDAASAEALLKGGADPGTAWRVMNDVNDPAMRALLDRYQKK